MARQREERFQSSREMEARVTELLTGLGQNQFAGAFEMSFPRPILRTARDTLAGPGRPPP